MNVRTLILVIVSLTGVCAAQDCPNLKIPTTLQWKYGEPETRAFPVLSAAPQEKLSEAVKFIAEYPSSDYIEGAQLIRLDSAYQLKDELTQTAAASDLMKLPRLTPASQIVSSITLASLLPKQYKAGTTDGLDKLATIERASNCGLRALTPTVPNFQAYSNTFNRGLAFVATERKQWQSARTLLLQNVRQDSTDWASYLMLGWAEANGDGADYSLAVFAFSKAHELNPSDSVARDASVAIYRALHGSDSGIENVKQMARTQVLPPVGFEIKPETHRGKKVMAGVAVAALFGALAYLDVRSGGSLFTSASEDRVVIYGGRNHTQFLGCLSCTPGEQDSILNPSGPFGSPVSPTSIFNSVSEYGSSVSDYSACSPIAKDPPVIVAGNGHYLGRLTMNLSHPEIGEGINLFQFLARLCVPQR